MDLKESIATSPIRTPSREQSQTSSGRNDSDAILEKEEKNDIVPPLPATVGGRTSVPSYSQKEVKAVTKIQALFRGTTVRNQVRQDPPLHVTFGRPAFEESLRKICMTLSPQKVVIFACAGPGVTGQLEKACVVLRGEGYQCGLVTEQFGS